MSDGSDALRPPPRAARTPLTPAAATGREMGLTWLDVYQRALAQGASAAGYYHHNIRMDSPRGPIIVRVPIPGAAVMDLRLWDEPEILGAVCEVLPRVPRILHVSQDPPFQIHGFIRGTVVDDIAPRGVRVPSHLLPDIVGLLAELAAFPAADLPPRPASWPAEGDTPAFARRLARESRRVYEANRHGAAAALYRRLAIPEDPFAPVETAWDRLHPRAFALVHSDLHRKNILVDEGRSFFLDWELALFGDPVYDLAVHLHKFGYQDDEQKTLVSLWESAMPLTHSENHAEDLKTYLAHEQIKSAVVDAVRYAEALATGSGVHQPDVMTKKLTTMLANARRHWGDPAPVDEDEVADALRCFSGGGRQ